MVSRERTHVSQRPKDLERKTRGSFVSDAVGDVPKILHVVCVCCCRGTGYWFGHYPRLDSVTCVLFSHWFHSMYFLKLDFRLKSLFGSSHRNENGPVTVLPLISLCSPSRTSRCSHNLLNKRFFSSLSFFFFTHSKRDLERAILVSIFAFGFWRRAHWYKDRQIHTHEKVLRSRSSSTRRRRDRFFSSPSLSYAVRPGPLLVLPRKRRPPQGERRCWNR